jgi:hypothetical protein
MGFSPRAKAGVAQSAAVQSATMRDLVLVFMAGLWMVRMKWSPNGEPEGKWKVAGEICDASLV